MNSSKDPIEISFNDGMPNRLRVSHSNEIVFIKLETLIRIEANGNYSRLFISNQSSPLTTSHHLGYYEKYLTEPNFLRIHAKHLINIQFIEKLLKVGHWQVQMEDKTLLDISDSRKKIVLARLGIE